jgi:hypothetical protein
MSFQIGFNFKFDLPLSMGIQLVDKVLSWLHWIFLFHLIKHLRDQVRSRGISSSYEHFLFFLVSWFAIDQ